MKEKSLWLSQVIAQRKIFSFEQYMPHPMKEKSGILSLRKKGHFVAIAP